MQAGDDLEQFCEEIKTDPSKLKQVGASKLEHVHHIQVQHGINKPLVEELRRIFGGKPRKAIKMIPHNIFWEFWLGRN